MTADAAAAAFDVGAAVASVEPHPSGHINDAFLVTAGVRRFLLQRLNPHVFPDPDAVMANVVTITDHLRAKGEPTLTLVPTTDGATSWRDDEGAVWRMYDYIDCVRPLEVGSPSDAAVVGRAFGRFHRLTVDLDPAQLRTSLPGFHDPERRLALFDEAVANAPQKLGSGAASLISIVERHRTLAKDGQVLASLPRRVVHNDAKAANLLIEEGGESDPIVVDLDTVMPGTVLWDVGDMVRSSTGTSDESARQVRFDEDRYRALLNAWVEETEPLLTSAELDAIPLAGPVVTYEQAMRFLTDHLQGDVYFRISAAGENLGRARNQLSLLQSMLHTLDV